MSSETEVVLNTKHQTPNTAVRTCRICGCTDANACLDGGTGPACHWVEEDLCSVCVPEDAALQEIEAVRFAAFAAAKQVWHEQHPDEDPQDEALLERDMFFLASGFNWAMEYFGCKDVLLEAMSQMAAERAAGNRILLPGQDY
ncbi:MAG TPA: hypothetical protein VGH74_01220 [Planctomycetaceae bacterium]|jgi:hypothetical protein